MEEKKSFKEWLNQNIILALVCALVIGLLIGAVVTGFVKGEVKIAKANGKTITSKDLFNTMKNYYSINMILEDIDKAILNNKYNLDEEELNDLKDTAKSFIESYQTYYGYTEEEFLSQNGFKDLDDFVDYLSLDYKRSVYFDEYLEKQLEPNAVENYYNENAFGKVNTKHILVETSEDMSDEDALVVANEIISRLKAGEAFDALAQEYIEKYEGSVITEDLGERNAFDHLEDAYIDGMKILNKGEFSTEPVKTSYGYHVIYCIDRTEKTDKISRKDRMAIVDILASDVAANDSGLYEKVLIEMREEANLKFYDKDLDEKYKEFCANYIEEETTKLEQN